MSIHLIVFDLDGTLLDSREKYFDCMRNVLRPYGCMPGFDRVIDETFGKPGREIMRCLGLNDAQIETASEEIRRYLSKSPIRSPQFVGMLEAMRYLKRTHLIAIATARSKEELTSDIDALPFIAESACVCPTAAEIRPKPAPDVLNHALEAARVPRGGGCSA